MTDISKTAHVNYNPGELNSLNRQVFESRYDHSIDTFAQFAQIFRKHYEYDVWQGTGPYLAVVLKVLSGPWAKNEASTGGTFSKTLLLDEIMPAAMEATVDAGKDSPTRIIAKIPEFDVDLDWPENNDDEARIAAHGEYHADPKSKQELGELAPGALVWVTYASDQPRLGADGKPTGYIIGVHSPALFVKDAPPELPQSVFKPKCPDPIVKDSEGSLYAGKTVADMIGEPPIRKIKGKIKTGFYGNGTAQTRAHFEEALLQSDTSYKHKVKGPAPGPNNSFIWIGHLKNNGFMDLLDRPISPGRETIVYASKMLDVNSDIEIKYYFHDEGGFGSSWVNGPSTTIKNAVKNATMAKNDFKEKIAPAIKDLIRTGRNCVLVIPEMMHSRGFGTNPANTDRYENIIIGATAAGVTGINLDPATVRSRIDSSESEKLRPLVKQYLKNIKVETTTNVLKVTRMRERMFSTFDGSYTGGNFRFFHQEVLDVLSEHLGDIRPKVSRISIVADGAGALTLAAMVKKSPTSGVQSKARTAFKTLKINQIDYISRPGKNDDGYYQFTKLPAYTIYEDYLLEKSELLSIDLVFNYIASNDERISAKKFFSLIGHEQKFDSSWNNSKQLFAVHTAKSALSKNFIILHKAEEKDKTGYAFSALPDSALELPTRIPHSADSITASGAVPPPAGIPDHAAAMASKKGLALLSALQNEQKKLKDNIAFWETGLFMELADAGGDTSKLCDYTTPDGKRPYSIYCSSIGQGGFQGTPGAVDMSSTFKYSLDTIFGIQHRKYFKDKKRYIEISDVVYGEIAMEMFILKFGNNLTGMDARLKELKEVKLPETKISDNYWHLEIAVGFNPLRFSSQPEMGKWVSPGNPEFGEYANAAMAFVKPDLIKKFISKLEKQIEKAAASGIKIPPECAEQPKPLKELVKVEPDPPGKKPAPAAFKCDDKTVLPNPAPKGAFGIYSLIPFAPSKKAWMASKLSGRYHGKGSPTGLDDVPGWTLKGFKYLRRTSSGTAISKKSKAGGVWRCIAPLIEKGMKAASEASGYYPYAVTSTIRGCKDCSLSESTGGKNGISLHSMGLAMDVDPFINGYSPSEKHRSAASLAAHAKRAMNSNFQGAFMPGIGDNERLEKMKVYSGGIEYRKRNIYEDDSDDRRLSENWKKMPDAYGISRKHYDKFVNRGKGTPIVPEGTNPLLWAIVFCETTGFVWGNGTFLKKKSNGGTFSKKEIKEINKIFKKHGINNVVERVRKISWNSRLDDAMHFHYYSGRSIISWPAIADVRKRKNLK